jgi:hypothetical protein
MAEFFDRYQQFKNNGQVKNLPFIKIPEKNTDKREVYKQGITRFDRLSQKYYGTPTMGWFILQANPQFGGMEFDIPDSSIIRIPFPFKQRIEEFFKATDDNLQL